MRSDVLSAWWDENDKAHELGPRILEFADELDTALRQPFSKEEMNNFERVLRALAETTY